MKRVKFLESARNSLSQYILAYQQYYRSLYQDSGLWCENIIVDNYLQEALKINDEITQAVINRLSGKIVYGKRILQDRFCVSIYCRHKYIQIEYLDNSNERIVADIQIK